MIILEPPFSNETFIKVKTLKDIKNTRADEIILFDYCESSLDLYLFCKKNTLNFAVKISNIKELIFTANLGAKYIFCDTINNAKDFQKIADNYLLDTKIIYLADSLEDINKIALLGIDGIKLKEKE